jgi:hypothetical protein
MKQKQEERSSSCHLTTLTTTRQERERERDTDSEVDTLLALTRRTGIIASCGKDCSKSWQNSFGHGDGTLVVMNYQWQDENQSCTVVAVSCNRNPGFFFDDHTIVNLLALVGSKFRHLEMLSSASPPDSFLGTHRDDSSDPEKQRDGHRLSTVTDFSYYTLCQQKS